MLFTSDILNFRTALGKLWLAGTVGVRRRPFSKEMILSSNIEEMVEALSNTKNPVAPGLSGTFLVGLCAILKQKYHFFQMDLMDVLKRLYSHQSRITDLSDSSHKKKKTRHAKSGTASILNELEKTLDELAFDSSEVNHNALVELDDSLFENSLDNPRHLGVSLFAARDEDLLLPESPLANLTSLGEHHLFDPLTSLTSLNDFEAALDEIASLTSAQEEEERQRTIRDTSTEMDELTTDAFTDGSHRRTTVPPSESLTSDTDNPRGERGDVTTGTEGSVTLTEIFGNEEEVDEMQDTGTHLNTAHGNEFNGRQLGQQRREPLKRNKMLIDVNTSLPEHLINSWRSSSSLLTHLTHQDVDDLSNVNIPDCLQEARGYQPGLTAVLNRATSLTTEEESNLTHFTHLWYLQQRGSRHHLRLSPPRHGHTHSPISSSTDEGDSDASAKRLRRRKEIEMRERMGLVGEVSDLRFGDTPPVEFVYGNNNRDDTDSVISVVGSDFNDANRLRESVTQVERLRGIFDTQMGLDDSDDSDRQLRLLMGDDSLNREVRERDRRSSVGGELSEVRGSSRRSSVMDPGDPMNDLVWQMESQMSQVGESPLSGSLNRTSLETSHRASEVGPSTIIILPDGQLLSETQTDSELNVMRGRGRQYSGGRGYGVETSSYTVETWKYRTYIENRLAQKERRERDERGEGKERGEGERAEGGERGLSPPPSTHLLFKEMVLPHLTDRLTASRALYHLLVLTTAGDTKVKQTESCGDIEISAGHEIFADTQQTETSPQPQHPSHQSQSDSRHFRPHSLLNSSLLRTSLPQRSDVTPSAFSDLTHSPNGRAPSSITSITSPAGMSITSGCSVEARTGIRTGIATRKGTRDTHISHHHRRGVKRGASGFDDAGAYPPKMRAHSVHSPRSSHSPLASHSPHSSHSPKSPDSLESPQPHSMFDSDMVGGNTPVMT